MTSYHAPTSTRSFDRFHLRLIQKSRARPAGSTELDDKQRRCSLREASVRNPGQGREHLASGSQGDSVGGRARLPVLRLVTITTQFGCLPSAADGENIVRAPNLCTFSNQRSVDRWFVGKRLASGLGVR